ncbi:DMT family protein [Cytophagaceae bacterium YF14B1]|uniref:DMT family protein n=1 Tax=Xanthocytophaga flava TaxID=3048013 RepID=A0AAE3UCJ3_9BACT|nr:DMT family protein [Xanthocytophaga flavus]MDJ1485538.1 DMT family protein [Xanthocytophaga flavus]
MKSIITIALLILSNAFMTLAWYGHLKFFDKTQTTPSKFALIVLSSWGLAFFEYCFQVPANRIGYEQNGGPFSLLQLKVIQEVIALTVFMVFAMTVFKNTKFSYNHLIGLGLLVLSVYFIFRKG